MADTKEGIKRVIQFARFNLPADVQKRILDMIPDDDVKVKQEDDVKVKQEDNGARAASFTGIDGRNVGGSRGTKRVGGNGGDGYDSSSSDDESDNSSTTSSDDLFSTSSGIRVKVGGDDTSTTSIDVSDGNFNEKGEAANGSFMAVCATAAALGAAAAGSASLIQHVMDSRRTRKDYEYIEYFRNINGCKWVADMIAMISSIADELPHDLLHPSARLHIRKCLRRRQRLRRRNARSWTTKNIAVNNYLQQQYGAQITWTDLVDPGLVAIAHMACHDAAKLMPRLRGLHMVHVIEYVKNQGTVEQEFFSFFCGVLASTWRFNSVMAAKPYKTRYEHAAVLLALRNANSRLVNYCINKDTLKYEERPPAPTNLRQLIDMRRW